MGTTNSANDEWLELHNNTALAINLDGWTLKAVDGAPEIKMAGVIPTDGFYLLERTDDSSVADINADQIYTGALNNNGEKLELHDNSGNLIDSADSSSGWPAGDNATKQTMSRLDLNQWKSSKTPGGTPGETNDFAASEMKEAEPPSSMKKVQPLSSKATLTETEPQLAAVGEQIPQTKSVSIIILLTALGLAAFSGAIILVLKKTIK